MGTAFGSARLAGLIVTAVVAFVGCAGNLTPGRQIDDAVLASEIRGALTADPDLSGSPIEVAVSSGLVTLTGQVDRPAQREKATNVVMKVAGVRDVRNLLSSR